MRKTDSGVGKRQRQTETERRERGWEREKERGWGVNGEKEERKRQVKVDPRSPHLTCAPSVRSPDDQTRPLTEGRNAVSKRSLKAHIHSRSLPRVLLRRGLGSARSR